MSKMTNKSRNYYFRRKYLFRKTMRIRLENEKLEQNPKDGNS